MHHHCAASTVSRGGQPGDRAPRSASREPLTVPSYCTAVPLYCIPALFSNGQPTLRSGSPDPHGSSTMSADMSNVRRAESGMSNVFPAPPPHTSPLAP
eukprot:8736813-Pyramimonas_sp.AAC.1